MPPVDPVMPVVEPTVELPVPPTAPVEDATPAVLVVPPAVANPHSVHAPLQLAPSGPPSTAAVGWPLTMHVQEPPTQVTLWHPVWRVH